MTTKTVSDSHAAVIESRDQLIAHFASGEKPPARWRIGTEHEKFVYSTADHHAPSWGEPSGIRALLIELEQHGWRPVEEGGTISALTGADGASDRRRLLDTVEEISSLLEQRTTGRR